MRGLRCWSYLLKGTTIPVLVFTDHANLHYYQEPRKIGPCISGYLLEQEQYNIILEYKPGTTNHADALSRRPDYKGPNPINDDVTIWCYDPGPHLLFSAIFIHLFYALGHLFPPSFPYTPLGLPPNHLTSYLMDHLTILQSDIICHHSAVRSIPQHHHLTFYGLPAYCHVMMEPPAHDGAILRTASS